MQGSLEGKKLLILGAYRSEIDIIQEARKHGIYTIVTDNHTDWSQAPAKYEADEAWDISWSDMDALSAKCHERGVDGCMAGFSERRVRCAQELSRLMGWPFYTDGADIDTIFNKRKFKDACRACGIQVPREYHMGEAVEYPVIVKPVDNGGSQGISVCYSQNELMKGYRKALELSDSHEVVIEEYITGDEAVIYYYIQDGRAFFITMCDRYVYKSESNVVQLPTAYIFPSVYTQTCIEALDGKAGKLFENLGIRNGVMFLQAFIRDGQPVIYEPGYRLNGARENIIVNAINGINPIEMLIRYSLTGKMSDEDIGERNDPCLKGKLACKLSPLMSEGYISDIRGIDEALKIPGVVAVIPNNYIGDEVTAENIGTLSQIAYRAFIVAESRAELTAAISAVHSKIQYTDRYGQPIPMVIFDTELLSLDGKGTRSTQ